MPLLTRRDFKLSTVISPKPKEGDQTLRGLLVHRLRDAHKAVLRVPLKANLATARRKDYSVHCEPCGKWFALPEWGEEVECPKCKRLFALEFAVFSVIANTND
ncbi:hypothetical protein GCM10020000_87970 [Streptomyces olivoverticillatus]